jgi:hypothetical protein
VRARRSRRSLQRAIGAAGRSQPAAGLVPALVEEVNGGWRRLAIRHRHRLVRDRVRRTHATGAPMEKRYIYLDTFACVRVAADPALASAARAYIVGEGFVLVVGAMNLMELVGWPKRWSEVVSFVSSVPFAIAHNPDKIAAREIDSYPGELSSLPIGFSSGDHSFPADEISTALSLHLRGKVADFEREFRSSNEEALRVIVRKRDSFLPEKSGRYSAVEREMFMQSSVLGMLFQEHSDFLRGALAAAQAEGRREGINIERFKSAYIQALAVFCEYYVQKKVGKVSDVGDILQLSLVPYVDLAVLDKERNDLIQRFNREALFPGSLRACSLADFIAMITNLED